MKSLRGPRRLLTDAQVEGVLTWWNTYSVYRAHRAAKGALARQNRVRLATIDRVIARGMEYRVPGLFDSTPGRRPLIRDANRRAEIHAWHTQLLAFEVQLRGLTTIERMARAQGVSTSTICRNTQTGGDYKQVSPEQRSAEVERHKRCRARLRPLLRYTY